MENRKMDEIRKEALKTLKRPKRKYSNLRNTAFSDKKLCDERVNELRNLLYIANQDISSLRRERDCCSMQVKILKKEYKSLLSKSKTQSRKIKLLEKALEKVKTNETNNI